MVVVSRFRSALAALLIAPSAAVAVGAVGASPAAAACPPDRGSLEEHAKDASGVFTGTVADRTVARHTVTLVVDAQMVFKGAVATSQVEVTTDARRARCGKPGLRPGTSYVFFVERRGDALSTDSRSGTAPATEQYVGEVERLLGTGRPAVEPEPEPATFTAVAGEPVELQRLAAPGVALVLVGVLGLVLVAWRGRRAS